MISARNSNLNMASAQASEQFQSPRVANSLLTLCRKGLEVANDERDNLVGALLAEKYQIIGRLRTSRVAVVYLAQARELENKPVAIKLRMNGGKEDWRDDVAFRNEVLVARQVRHGNVIEVYEYLRGSGWSAYVMEFAESGDLADRLSRKGKLGRAESIRILLQICAGLKAFHSVGITHCDLKPENILINKNGEVKICDFGAARSESLDLPNDDGILYGTPGYMSHEYLTRRVADRRSDIFSLGVIAYEMLNGTIPSKRISPSDFTFQQIFLFLSRSLVRTTLFERVIAKALRRDPAQRYQTIDELTIELEGALCQEEVE